MVKRSRTPQQREELARFVRRVFAASGAETWSELAQASGVHEVSISRWQTGRDVPDGYNLMRLLRGAGLLPTQLLEDGDADVAASVPRSLAAKLDELLDEVRALAAAAEVERSVRVRLERLLQAAQQPLDATDRAEMQRAADEADRLGDAILQAAERLRSVLAEAESHS